MVYCILGDDFVKSHECLKALVAKFIDKKNCARVDLNDDNFSETSFNELIKTESLFGQKFLVVLRGVFRNEVFAGFLDTNLKKCGESMNTFIFLEESMEEKRRKEIKKHVSGFWEFSLPSARGKKQDEDKELFLLCDEMAFRKKHNSWLLFQEAVFLKKIPPEDIFWKVFWQIKTLLVVKRGDAIKFKPYFYNKMKRASVLFTQEDLRGYSSELLNLFHNSRRGVSDLAVGLESFILRI